MTVHRSPLSLLSEIGYHLYTLFLFTKNDILTAIIPVVRTMLLSSYRRSLHNVSDIVWYRLGPTMQRVPPSAYHHLGLAPHSAVRSCEPDQGTRRRQGQQTIEAASCR